MIKKDTQKRINIAVVNYLNIVGLWKSHYADSKNPIMLYFLSNMSLTDSPDIFAAISSMKYDNYDSVINVLISNDYFHLMIKEFYNIYKKLDEIYSNQDEFLKEFLNNIIGNEYDIENYINSIFDQYKHSFYEILRYYNSNNEEYNQIKIEILSDKMYKYVECEEYEEAAILRDKIKELKEKGK